jgi:hypothetical protein
LDTVIAGPPSVGCWRQGPAAATTEVEDIDDGATTGSHLGSMSCRS